MILTILRKAILYFVIGRMSETLEIPANTWEIKESEKQERSDTSSTNLEQQSQQEISSLTQETKDKLWKLT